ncbi:hypothetical protein O181_129022 [Austropuccinia psidii MF-1]|uniref:Uncharacterized protein n=1 Tax=Austropuccinia psidii MF-1 TaxID=1389203 RepID=A0A9Q3L105_9BASI|nr:hypothetical protein [Austropuccinia psidii MF-1]
MTLLYWCCGNSNLTPSWGQLPTPYLYGQFGPLWCSMAFWPYQSSLGGYGLRPYPAILGLPGQFFHTPNPQGVLGPLSRTSLYEPPLPLGGLGPKWPFWDLGPLWHLRSMGHNHGPRSLSRGPRSMGQLGPFWPNPMRQKGAKGGSPSAPKARWAHLSQFGLKSHQTENGNKDPQDPISPNNQRGPLFSPWPLVVPRGHQISPAQAFPSP